MDYLRGGLRTLAALTIIGFNVAPSVAIQAQDLVLSGRLVNGPAGGGSMAVRLRCPGFQTETWATGSGFFTLRMPRPTEDGLLSSSPPSDHNFDDDFFSAHQLRGSTDCTLEVLASGAVLTRFRIAVPQGLQHVEIGDLELPDLAGRGPGNRPTVHWTSLSAPPEASAACREARQELDKDRPDLVRADRLLRTALRLHPKMAEAWELLGIVEDAAGDSGSARSDFEKSLELNADSYETYTFLAQLDAREKKWKEAFERCNSALAVEPTCLRAQYLRAFAAYNLGDFDTARISCRRVRASGEEDRFADIAVVEALLLAQEGKTVEASSILQFFLEHNPGYEYRSALKDQLAIWASSGE
jgi:hypothetical protein